MKFAGTGYAGHSALRGVPSAVTYALEIFAIVAGYAGLAGTELIFPWINPTATILWPPTGLALALFLLRGRRIWPAVLLGSFVAGVLAARSLLAPGLAAIGVSVAAFTGALLVERWSTGVKTFRTTTGVAKFALICFVPTAIVSSIFAITGLILADDATFSGSISITDAVSSWASTLATWYIADAAASLIVAPVVVLWAISQRHPLSKSKWVTLEAAAVFLVTIVIGIIAFIPLDDGPLADLQPYQGAVGFLILLPLFWAGLRGDQRAASTAALIFCASRHGAFRSRAACFRKPTATRRCCCCWHFA